MLIWIRSTFIFLLKSLADQLFGDTRHLFLSDFPDDGIRETLDYALSDPFDQFLGEMLGFRLDIRSRRLFTRPMPGLT